MLPYNFAMRRAATFALLSIFGWMLIAPLCAPSGDAALPPCCRRHGKHHCSMMEPLGGQQRGVRTIQEKCPFARVAKGSAHVVAYRPESTNEFLDRVAPQPVSSGRVASFAQFHLDRSHRKRGPPALFL